MPTGLDNLKKKEYPGRVIILGVDRTGENTVIVYTVTGRSPSSQARKIVFEDNRFLVKPSDESIVQTGRIELLIYPAVVLSGGIVISNGRQTADILSSLQDSSSAVEVLQRSLSRWEFEPDKPTYTPRISGCVLSSREAALSIIKRAGDGTSIRDYFKVQFEPGEGKMIATYSGENEDPLPSFPGEPEDVSFFEKNAEGTAEAVYEAMKPREKDKDFRVAVACVYCQDIARDRFTHCIINRGERKVKVMTKIDKTTRQQYRTKVEEDFQPSLKFGDIRFRKKLSMRYGENPGYPAAFYQEEGASGPNMATFELLQEGSKGLGYINVGDMDLGQRLVRKLTSIYTDRCICALIKHEMPSGVAMGDEPVETFHKAWKCDSLSNFGSVDVFNFTVDERLAEIVVEKGRNIEVVYAPDFTAGALEVFTTRKPLRVVKMGAPCQDPSLDTDLEFKRVAGGLLVQKRFDSRIVSRESVDVVSKRKPTDIELDAAVFSWNVACFTRSNAIVIATEDKVHGIGSGQRSRIDAAEDAIRLSHRGYGPQGCVMASDAFMPFPDVVEVCAENGIAAIIYPLGSVRDEEVIATADKKGLAMIVTKKPGDSDSERCFLHR